MLVAEHFDTGPVPVIADADVSLGSVAVESLEIDKLKVSGDEVDASELTTT